jgi:hypothetical protein
LIEKRMVYIKGIKNPKKTVVKITIAKVDVINKPLT